MKATFAASAFKKMFLVVGGLVLVLSFQNCSPINTTPVDGALSSKGDGSDDDGSTGGSTSGSTGSSSGSTGSSSGSTGGSCHEKKDDAAKLVADCAAAKKKAVAASGDIKNMAGSQAFKINSAGVISGISGKTIIVADSVKSATITAIEDIRGSLIVCDAVVGQITDVAGDLTIVNTQVGDVETIRGSVKSHKSSIKSVSDVRGSVKEIK